MSLVQCLSCCLAEQALLADWGCEGREECWLPLYLRLETGGFFLACGELTCAMLAEIMRAPSRLDSPQGF